LDTLALKDVLGDVALNTPDVSAWIREAPIEMKEKVFKGDKL